MLLQAPDGHISVNVKGTISEWTEPIPTALEILKTLDTAVYEGGASEFSMGVFNTLFNQQLLAEHTTLAVVASFALWRNCCN